ncbi:MAG: hypothetical protein MJA29_12330, partial [Candidatus Omnitrophica bacterium]|nr:hypothetical protein [Candidatus Omnitrophota bacterium]
CDVLNGRFQHFLKNLSSYLNKLLSHQPIKYRVAQKKRSEHLGFIGCLSTMALVSNFCHLICMEFLTLDKIFMGLGCQVCTW